MSDTECLYELIRLVRPVHRRLARGVEAKLEGTGLNVGMRAVLEVLYENGSASVPTVARQLFLNRQQIQLVMNSLEEDGFVSGHENPAHKKSRLFALTKEGSSVFEKVKSVEAQEMMQIAAAFSPADLRSAKKVLSAIFEHLSDFEDDPNKPGGLA